jgi:pimeloyl-ACP methyl ester carboxylesterase
VNPIEKASILATHKIPVFIIHGEEDTVVPLAENSGRLEQIYKQNQVGDLITLVRIKDQGHSFWPGYFNSQELVYFVIKQALTKIK